MRDTEADVLNHISGVVRDCSTNVIRACSDLLIHNDVHKCPQVADEQKNTLGGDETEIWTFQVVAQRKAVKRDERHDEDQHDDEAC